MTKPSFQQVAGEARQYFPHRDALNSLRALIRHYRDNPYQWEQEPHAQLAESLRKDCKRLPFDLRNLFLGLVEAGVEPELAARSVLAAVA